MLEICKYFTEHKYKKNLLNVCKSYVKNINKRNTGIILRI